MSGERAENFNEATELLRKAMDELYPDPGEARARLAEMEAHDALGLPEASSEASPAAAGGGDSGDGDGEVSGSAENVQVTAVNVRWERPTARSFWNALADPEREALAATGVEQVFPAGTALCREGDDTSQVMIIDSGWVKVSIRVEGVSGEIILAVRGQGDVIGERAALTTQVRSATVTALDKVSAMVVQAERFAEFLQGHPRAAEVLERQVTERRNEDRARLLPGDRGGAERRLAWLLFDLAQRRGGYQHASAATFTLPMSQTELADWAGTSADAVSRFLRSWRERGIIARSERARRLTVVDLDALAAIGDAAPAGTAGEREAADDQGVVPVKVAPQDVAVRWLRGTRRAAELFGLAHRRGGLRGPQAE